MDGEVEHTPRALPDDLSKELLQVTNRLRNALDDLPVEIWGEFRLGFEDSNDVIPNIVTQYGIFESGEIRPNWYVDKFFTQNILSLNIPRGPDDPPLTRKMFEQEAIRTYAHSSILGGGAHVNLDSMMVHRQLPAYLNSLLERAVDLVKTLEERITELELRPPELGGPAYEKTKNHWESNVDGHRS